MSALSWLRKTSFDMKSQSVHNAAARRFAQSMMEEEFTLTTIHKAGKKNIIADILSRDTNLSHSQLNFVFANLFPTQIPNSLEFANLDTLIISELSSLKRLLPNPMASPQQVVHSNVGNLINGFNSWHELESMIHSWKKCHSPNRTNSFAASLKVSEEISLAAENSPFSELQQFVPPLAAFVRPFGRTFGTPLA